ncbi:MAG: SCO family protein [Terriglobales bacterium]
MKMLKAALNTIAVTVACIVCGGMALAQGMAGPVYQAATPPPQILTKVGIDQNLNHQVPLDLAFTDESGRAVKLRDYFGSKPVVLSLVYYECPMLCTETLNGMVSAFKVLKFEPGKEFNVVTVSFNSHETPQLAAQKKANYLRQYGRPGAEQGWHFLIGSQASIDALTNAVGFHYAWDQTTQQFAHATGIMVLTPDGKIAQYYYGVEYSPRDLRLGIVQASKGQVGTVVDQVLLYCFHYDPRTGKYGAVITRVLQVAGVATIVFLGGFMFLMFRLEPKYDDKRRAGGKR